MNTVDGAAAQLRAIEWLDGVLGDLDIAYWLFGGWAVDFHLGRVTREHADVDLAVWQSDLPALRTLLEAHGWVHAPDAGENGYTGFEHGQVRVELAFLDRDLAGVVFTPLVEGRGEWPPGSFGAELAAVNGVQARVVGLAALIEDKSGPRDDAEAARKDRADVALLALLAGVITER